MALYCDYAMKNGGLVHVSEVESGLKCGCTCPACNDLMVAKKGKIRIHHFAHKTEECPYSLQTIIHYLAKHILEKEKHVLLPPGKTSMETGGTLFAPRNIEFDNVFIEKKLDDIIPDIVIDIDGKLLLIEIYVTHKVTETKLEKIKSKMYSTIEINLSKYYQLCKKENKTISYNELRHILIEEVENKYWLYNPYIYLFEKNKSLICEEIKSTFNYEEHVSHLEEMGFSRRIINKPLIQQVLCPQEVDMVEFRTCESCIFCWEKNKFNGYVVCSGKSGVHDISTLKQFLEKPVLSDDILLFD